MKRINSLTAALLGAGLIATGSASALDLSSWFGVTKKAPAVAATGAPNAAAPTAIGAALAPDYRAIVERYGPAVVGVTVEGTRKTQSDDSDGANPFAPFFRGFPGMPDSLMAPKGGTPFRGQGSGFIVSADGLVLTNAHVVQGADEVTVKLPDRREYRAKVLGADPMTDIAVLRIDAKEKLPVVRIGDSKTLHVGDYVLAIGAPFGFEQTATQGIVSGKGRSLPGDAFVPFIQTDAAINPGNSGGPLFDASNGSVIGINAQIYSRTGGYQGLGFAIPIDVAMKVKDQIVATGKASHALLGVSIQQVNQTLADSFKLDKPEGALVSSVVKGGPADKAGLESGDVIRKFNGAVIVESGDLPALIGQAVPGEKVTLEIWRHGRHETLTAKLGNAGDKAVKGAAANDAPDKARLGLALRPLQPQEKREAGVDHGLLVEDAGGPAALAGVQAGDVLLAVNGEPVTSIDQVRAVVAKAKSVALLIQRDGNKIFVPVHVG